jgi:hypothetical protein
MEISKSKNQHKERSPAYLRWNITGFIGFVIQSRGFRACKLDNSCLHQFLWIGTACGRSSKIQEVIMQKYVLGWICGLQSYLFVSQSKEDTVTIVVVE